jgi:signal transduction histidine kinase
MKLFTRYFRINLLATLIIFLLASVAFYNLLWYVMIGQVDDDLKIEQREIESYVNRYHRPPEPIIVKDQLVSFESIQTAEKIRKFETIKSPDKTEPEDFRQLSFTLAAGNQWYLFRVSKSLEGTQHMNRSIIIISLITVMVILLVGLLINRWQVRRLWQPFYSTLAGIEKFRLGEKSLPGFAETQIDEFNLLNKTLDQFIQGAEREYSLLKEFTENASHELQTPLAIVHSKLDMMIQDERLSEKQSNAVQTAYEAIQKMSKLNQSLLLLSKIENRQFSETYTFDFQKLVEEKLAAWQELWQGRNLKVISSSEPTSIIMNRELAEILLNNLFSNAMRHAADGGSINMQLRNGKFIISNTASNGSLDPGKLFKRFSKAGQSTDQHGLGLSIIRQIVEVSGWKVSYHFADNQHFFIINF